MPDQADIEQALAALGAEALRDDPAEVRVYRGWPRAASLEADLQAGRAHLSVTPGGAARDATRYPMEWQGVVPAPTLRAAVDGETATFGGVAGPGQVAGLRVDGVAYACRLRDGDTPGAVAAVLAGLVRVDRPVELHGAAVNAAWWARVAGAGRGGWRRRDGAAAAGATDADEPVVPGTCGAGPAGSVAGPGCGGGGGAGCGRLGLQGARGWRGYDG